MIEARLKASDVIDDACSGTDMRGDEGTDLYFFVFNKVRAKITQHKMLDAIWRQTLYTEGGKDA
jgi:hypothetical protein